MSWVIDRIEEGTAVLEDIDSLEITTRAAGSIPPGAKDGDVISYDAGSDSLYIDYAETETRRKRIREKFERLRARRRS